MFSLNILQINNPRSEAILFFKVIINVSKWVGKIKKPHPFTNYEESKILL